MSVVKKILSEYESRTPSSIIDHKTAQKSLPGGDTRWAAYFKPYPTYMASAKGCYLNDVDGNRYMDFQNNYTVLINGHRPDPVLEAVRKAINEDFLFGAPSRAQYQLAELLTERLPSVDTLRFVNSGTEASMMAMRTARAYTGKDIIIKFDGAYHGSHDFGEINTSADVSGENMPIPKPSKPGIPSSVLENIKIARFNEIDTVKAICEAFPDRIAGIILEPVLNTAGIIEANLDFVKELRTLADAYKALLIFDEIVTLRLSTGGYQGITGIMPDLTCLGKSIGGGFPIGAFGGKAEIMDMFNPITDKYRASGTFNGHHVSVSAGYAALSMFNADIIKGMNDLGIYFKQMIDRAFDENGIRGHATQVGSLLYLHWTDHAIKDAIDVVNWKKNFPEIDRYMHLSLMNKGIFSANRGLLNLSSPMTREEVENAGEIIFDCIQSLKPYVKEKASFLLK